MFGRQRFTTARSIRMRAKGPEAIKRNKKHTNRTKIIAYGYERSSAPAPRRTIARELVDRTRSSLVCLGGRGRTRRARSHVEVQKLNPQSHHCCELGDRSLHRGH